MFGIESSNDKFVRLPDFDALPFERMLFDRPGLINDLALFNLDNNPTVEIRAKAIGKTDYSMSVMTGRRRAARMKGKAFKETDGDFNVRVPLGLLRLAAKQTVTTGVYLDASENMTRVDIGDNAVAGHMLIAAVQDKRARGRNTK